MAESTERFSDRVTNYVKYRPGYPAQLIDCLRELCGLNAASIIADIGSGTGISARPFLEMGCTVLGVEPNAAMRQAAEQILAGHSRFVSVDGTAESTTLESASAKLVIAAQAFHWFDASMARMEFKRISKPGGWIALAWNERRLDADDFHREYESLLIKFGTDYQTVRAENVSPPKLEEFFEGHYLSRVFSNEQWFDLQGLRGRLLSSSYIPNENDAVFPELEKELNSLFKRYAESGKIKILYDTNLYLKQY